MSSFVHFVASLNAEKIRKKCSFCDDPPYINLKDGVKFSFGTFLATLVALHFTPVSKWVSES